MRRADDLWSIGVPEPTGRRRCCVRSRRGRTAQARSAHRMLREPGLDPRWWPCRRRRRPVGALLGAGVVRSESRSSSRCLRTKVRGFRSEKSNSPTVSPSSDFNSVRAVCAISRSCRRVRPASRASCGNRSGPKTTSAMTPSTINFHMLRSNGTIAPPALGSASDQSSGYRRFVATGPFGSLLTHP